VKKRFIDRAMNVGIFAIFCGVILASGCATKAPESSFTAVQQARSDEALVYVYRPKRTVIGAAGWIEPRIDGESLGRLRNGTYAVYSASPGKHSFQYRYSHPIAGPTLATAAAPEAASSDGPKVDMTLEAGQVYYVVYPAQRLVDPSKAMKNLAECREVEPTAK
jgi:hypothetical protein